MSCKCGMCNGGQQKQSVGGVRMSKQLKAALGQLDTALETVDLDGVLYGYSRLAENEKDPKELAELVGELWSAEGVLLCKRAKRIVAIVENMEKPSAYPNFGKAFRDYVEHIFSIYALIASVNVCGFVNMQKSSTFDYMKRMAKGAGKLFDIPGVPQGLGVINGLGQIDFIDTRFICVEDKGISGMTVQKSFTDGTEKVMVKNNDGAFDYEKAAMALLLKAIMGSKAVDVVTYVENGLKEANAVSAANKNKKGDKGEKSVDDTPASVQSADDNTPAPVQSADEFEGMSKMEKELTPNSQMGFYEG